MKILAISDTHFMSPSLIEAIYQNRKEDIDAMIHCGDFCKKEEELHIPNFYIVAGNNDFEIKRDHLKLNMGNKTVFVTHGHRYDVEFTIDSLVEKGKEEKADILLYGHTHIAFDEMIEGMLVVNPGSPSIPRGYKMLPTYCIIDTDTLQTTFYHAKTHEVIDIHYKEPKKKEGKKSFFSFFKK